MLYLYPLLLLALSLVVSASPIPVQTHSRHEEPSSEPVRWITHFGPSIPADTKVNLEWTGGSGLGFELYYIPQWPQQTEYYPIEIASDVQETHYTWRTPKQSEYPHGTTFIVGINDKVTSLGSGWFDITGMVPFGDQ
ncbi:hypothetical protein IAU60_006837 [Kwoniella sp. DSM 27419]